MQLKVHYVNRLLVLVDISVNVLKWKCKVKCIQKISQNSNIKKKIPSHTHKHKTWYNLNRIVIYLQKKTSS